MGKCLLLSVPVSPGTAGGPGGRDQMLALKTLETQLFLRKKINIFFLHISSSYAKLLGEKLFRTWEIPQSGSKANKQELHRPRSSDFN